jgi:putative IMPACT (imprinted ancient) family translation regulator
MEKSKAIEVTDKEKIIAYDEMQKELLNCFNGPKASDDNSDYGTAELPTLEMVEHAGTIILEKMFGTEF